MTDKELINKIQTLKQIKPNANWASLVKSEIFAQAPVVTPNKSVGFGDVWSRAFGVLTQPKVAYAFAMLLVALVGTFGYMTFVPSKNNVLVMDNSKEVLALKNNVAEFKAKSQTFADLAKTDPASTNLVVDQVREVATQVTNAIKKDPSLAKTVALDINNNKTLLDIAGGNSVAEVSDMYETIVTSLISDLSERTLSPDKMTELARIKKYVAENHDYATALRDILLISQTTEGN